MIPLNSTIKLVVRVLNLSLDYFRKRQREASYEERQEERNKVEEDPADWFGEHFSGDRVQLDAEPKPESDDGKADKAED